MSALPISILINVLEFGKCLPRNGNVIKHMKTNKTLPSVNKCSSAWDFFLNAYSSTTLCINSCLKRYKEFKLQNLWIKYVFVVYPWETNYMNFLDVSFFLKNTKWSLCCILRGACLLEMHFQIIFFIIRKMAVLLVS